MRAKIFRISKRNLLHTLIRRTAPDVVSLPRFPGPWPSDAKVHHVFIEYNPECIGVVVESEEFEDVKDGYELPITNSSATMEYEAFFLVPRDLEERYVVWMREQRKLDAEALQRHEAQAEELDKCEKRN